MKKRNSYIAPKPTPKDWEIIGGYWNEFLKAENWIKTNFKTANYTEINNAKIKHSKYRKLISQWNSKFRLKTNRYGRELQTAIN